MNKKGGALRKQLLVFLAVLACSIQAITMPYTAAAAMFPAPGELQVMPTAPELPGAFVLTEKTSLGARRMPSAGKHRLLSLTGALLSGYPQQGEKYAWHSSFFPAPANVRFPVRSNGP